LYTEYAQEKVAIIDELDLTLMDVIGLNKQDAIGAKLREVVDTVRKVLQSKLDIKLKKRLNKKLKRNTSYRCELRKGAQNRAVEHERTLKIERENQQLNQRTQHEEEDIVRGISSLEGGCRKTEKSTSVAIQQKDDDTCLIGKQDEQMCPVSAQCISDLAEEFKSTNVVMDQSETAENALDSESNDDYTMNIEKAEDPEVQSEERTGN